LKKWHRVSSVGVDCGAAFAIGGEDWGSVGFNGVLVHRSSELTMSMGASSWDFLPVVAEHWYQIVLAASVTSGAMSLALSSHRVFASVDKQVEYLT
jgi:hypothetical protein